MIDPLVERMSSNSPRFYSESRILHFSLDGGTLVCIHSQLRQAGGGVQVKSTETNSLKLLDQLFQQSGSGVLSIKIIGPKDQAATIFKYLKQRGHHAIKLVEVSSSGTQVYFYTRSGRTRVGELNSGIESKINISRTATKEPAVTRKKKVLIVDDSKTIRHLLSKILQKDFDVVGCAEFPSQVEKMIETLKPDVITLDIHMPEMDGVTLLKRYLPKFKIPTIMISSISMEESDLVLKALEAGAIDYIKKPSLTEIDVIAPLIVEKVKTTAAARMSAKVHDSTIFRRSTQAPAFLNQALSHKFTIAIGASTGGTEALRSVLTRLPKSIPPIVIVQHIPPVFSTAFANRLNEICNFPVKEAKDGDLVKPDQVLIAPGGLQMSLERNKSGQLYVSVADGPPVNRHKPSVDVLFDSVAKLCGKNAIGVILTGMGSDGAKGLLRMRQAGARTIGQNEETCVVYGMPQAAAQLKAIEQVSPLNEIPEEILKLLRQTSSIRKTGT